MLEKIQLMTDKHLTDQKFSDLNLDDLLKQGLANAGFEFCTPIQEQSLPIALTGKDVAGQAQTGTGKTISFLLACCQYLISNPGAEDRKPTQVRSIILAPTRELAIQIHKDALVLAKETDIKFGLIYGGTGYEEQKQMIADGMDVLIGTPGRLIDFYKQQLFDLKHVQVVVLDEADRMFDLGFIKDIRFLLRRMPKPEDRLNMLFSATLSFRVMELAYEHMNDPEEIKIDADVRVADKIEEYCFYPADDEKPNLLINLLKNDNPERILVFVNTRHAVDRVSRTLTANGFSAAALSGDVPQRKRESLLDGFKNGKHKVLVATDVAARGLHIPEVTHVYNYDLPQDAEDYVHRIGRTARAGESGVAISFLCEKYAYSIMDIESYIGHSIPKREIEKEMLTEIAPPAVAAKSGKPSKGNSRKDRASQSRPNPNKTKKLGQAVAAQSTIPELANQNPEDTVVADSSLTQPQIDATQAIMSHSDPTTQIETNTVVTALPEILEQQAKPIVGRAEAADTKAATVKTQDNIPSKDTEVVEQEANTQPNTENTQEQNVALDTAAAVSNLIKSAPATIAHERFSRKFGEVPLIG